jgi:uncharacterized protein YdeI (YjbR/CyaY-like superfamily)
MLKDKRIDAYIAQSAGFAKPILNHLRKVVHSACPDVEETLKWGMPSFMYRGKILCGIAAFKQHAAFWFWRGTRLDDPEGYLGKTGSAMGNFGRITSLAGLPPRRVIAGFIKQAMRLNGAITPSTPANKKSKPAPRTPADLLKAIRANRTSVTTFTSLTPGHKREYIEWIADAKRPETRARRIATAVRWLADGKKHNWKYAR